MKEFARASNNARVIFHTGSGTAAMETTVMNTLTAEDKAIDINGGSFGHRFVQLYKNHALPYSEIKLDTGKSLTTGALEKFDGKGYTAFLVNVHETSTGVYYDINLINEFCKRIAF